MVATLLHAILTPIRYAERAAQVKQMLYRPFGREERKRKEEKQQKKLEREKQL